MMKPQQSQRTRGECLKSDPSRVALFERLLRELAPLPAVEVIAKSQELRLLLTTKHLQCAVPALAVIGAAIWLFAGGMLSSVLTASLVAAACVGWWRAVRYYDLPLNPSAYGLHEFVRQSELDELASIAQRDPVVASELSRWAAHHAEPTYEFYMHAKMLDRLRARVR